jgi:protein-tyrosine phosphatase
VIDLHCHILPALDDGAIDLDDSLAMARQAEQDGIAIVSATPHIRDDHDVRVIELADRVMALNDALEGEGIPVEIATGGEVAEATLETADDDCLEHVSLGGAGCWLLVEPKPGPLSDSLVEAVGALTARGYRSVIAHPERHAGADFWAQLRALVDCGALVQGTAALVADGPASPTMLEMAGKGLLHLLGSDAHSSHGGRPVRLSEGFARLAEVEKVRPHLDWMAREAPQAILKGEHVTPPLPPG